MSQENATGQTGQGQGQDQIGQELGNAMDNWGPGENPVMDQGQGGSQGQGQGTQTPGGDNVVSRRPAPQEPAISAQQQAAPTIPTQQQGAASGTTVPQQSTAELIRAAVESTAAAVRQSIPAPAQPPPRQMSDAEFAAHYGIPQVDAKGLERLFDKDPNAAAAFLNDVLRQTQTATLRMAQDLYKAEMQSRMTTLQPRLSQMEQFIAAENERRAGERFYTSYPNLRGEEPLVKEILDATQAKIQRGELKFSNESEAFKFIADSAAKLTARMAPAAGSGSPSQQGRQNPQGRQMATASSAARPGGGNAQPVAEIDKVMASW